MTDVRLQPNRPRTMTTRSRIRRPLLAGLLTATTLLAGTFAFVTPAEAVSTRHFTLDDAGALAAGELDGAMVTSDGRVRVGVAVRRVELGGAALAHSIVRGEGDTVFVGTGDEGKVFRVRGDDVSVLAETGQLLVSSLALAGTTLYAGTLPEGRIFAIDTNSGEMREFVQLEETEHVWDLVWDAERRRLFAATGPEGKVFAIDAQGRAQVYFDAEDAHVLSLAFDPSEGGGLFAGTSDDAVVYRLRGPNEAEVVYDFPGNEVTALDARDGALFVAANEMPAPRPASSSKSKNARTPRPGKGRLFRVDPEGRTERVFSRDDAHFTSVRIGEDGLAYVGAGKEGRVYRVSADHQSATWADVDERQVLAFEPAEGNRRAAFVTGDAAALYRVDGATPDEAVWTSKVLDAGFSARFGQLSWRASGRIEWQTRSGNSEEPDASWSEWSAAIRTPGPVRSPGARFVQVRARLAEADAVIRAVSLYYLPQNQRALVHHIATKNGSSPRTTYPLTWKVNNPDSDDLRYRLRYRAEGQTRWRPMFRENERVTSTSYDWDTSGLPDGWYEVAVAVSDELANPRGMTLRGETVSEPILVDNHPPRIEGLSARGNTVSGRAIDAMGPISRLEMSVDGDPWEPVHPRDHLLDTADERFEITLESLEPGEHIVAIRARDAGGNETSDEVTFTVR